MHGVVKFDPKTGQQYQSKSKTMSYTNYFADALIAEAERDKRVVAVHAAMAGGTGLTRCDFRELLHHQEEGKEGRMRRFPHQFLTCWPICRFEKRFPDRVFDVGIAEQHAITFAAGLACEGLVPFATIYSSFIQRGYDQIVHDVSLQKLPGKRLMICFNTGSLSICVWVTQTELPNDCLKRFLRLE